ncbi:MAG TPA: ABC-F family ATP-binding cassette domain-containing protein [Candidatus Babeliales bacterium]|nr:ABC-F family ATP-binding cassette domain-containing protein [Candidatus Babeliales bacterium]
MIHADNINLSFGSQVVFNDISFTVQQDQKVGLVGRNGSGKSTLLHAIIDNSQLDSGSLKYLTSKKIAYLPQNVVLESDRSIIDETVRAIKEIADLLDKAALLQHQMTSSNDTAIAIEYAQVQATLADYNLEQMQAQAKRILQGLGLSTEQFDMPVSTLSVGWKMRVVLAKLLLQDADFYLFDEPTNHLDLIAKEWFLEFLKNASFGFMIVCHERYFLDELCSHILSLERGKGIMYTGNYSKFLAQKEHNDALLRSAYVNQQKEIKQKKETIERFRASASKAKMAQSMIKALDKIEIIELPPSDKIITFNFGSIKPSSRTVLEVKNVAHSFGDKQIFKNVSCEIERGQKVAIVAANGVGKTTLLNIINGKIPCQQGTINVGGQVTSALFEQDQNKMLNKDMSILENVTQRAREKTEQAVRSLLGAFLFSNDDVKKKVGVLSGGEKNRVGMVCTLLNDANLLMLDEPTNHLDIQSKEILLRALKTYTGTMIFVSHDRDFVNDLATHILELTPTGAFLYHGNFDSFLYQKKYATTPGAESNGAKPSNKQKDFKEELSAGPKKSNKELFLLRKESNRLERMVTKAEQKAADLQTAITAATWGSDEATALQKQLVDAKATLQKLTAEWEAVEKSINE